MLLVSGFRQASAVQRGVVDRVAAALPDSRAARWFRAPGRVNLMGDHTDYNEGFVLPMAIELECVIAASPRGDGRVRVRSLDEGDAVEVAADGSAEPRGTQPAWGRYVAGIVRALSERGRAAEGIDAVLASSVPEGSGLSSSAALEVSCALALAEEAGLQLAPKELALACQAAEHLATGVASGIMDQFASAAGREGSALLIDCRSLEIEYVETPPDFVALIVHSGIPRTLEGSAYAERRAGCERIAATLGIPALRDARPEEVADEPLGRHVVSENARVREAAEALRANDLERLGEIFTASHASLRDDYDVSTPELDVLVESLVAAGAYGARLTGAGFGGAVVAACAAADAERVAADATTAYNAKTGREPTTWTSRPVAGAGAITW